MGEVITKLFLFSFIGSILGFIFGLIPGFHPNLFSNLEAFDKLSLAIFLVALGTAFNFSQAILSLGIGFRSFGFVIGKDLKRVLKDGLIISILIVLFFPIFFLLKIFKYLKPIIPIFLLIVSIHIALKEKPLQSLLIFFSSGILGLLVLWLDLCKNPLTPLFIGLFGIPSLIFEKEKIVEEYKPNYLLTILACLILVLLPGLTPIHSSIIIADIFEENVDSLIAGVNFGQTISSIASWYFIGKAREGYLDNCLRNLEKSYIFILILAYIISTLISYFISKLFIRINLSKFKSFVLLFSILSTIVFSGIEGLLVLLSSFLIGLECIRLRVPQINCMGAIIIPTVFWYF